MSFEPARIDIPLSKINHALKREMSSEEQNRAYLLLDQVIDEFEQEAFGGVANYGFGRGQATQRLRSNAGAVYLPYGQVTNVVDVRTDNDALVSGWKWREFQPSRLETSLPTGEFAIVTYDWVLEVSDAVVSMLADSIARTIRVPDEVLIGAQQTTDSLGPASQTLNFASWAVGGQARLSPEERKRARLFRPKNVGATWVMRS